MGPQRDLGCTGGMESHGHAHPQSSLGLLLQLQNPLSLSLPSGLPQTTFQGSGQALGAGDLGSHPDSALTLSVTNQALSEPQSS